jgi:hypothetical protein
MYTAAMAGALADVTGVETIKTLVACLGVPDFTVDELARQAGVSRRTVDTVVRRYQYAFDRLPSGKQDGPGRPPVRWSLRADHLDEVLAAVDSHQSALGPGWRSEVADAPEPDTVETSLIMAAAALTRGSDDPEQAEQLVAAARNSLTAAGFGPDGSPWTEKPDQELAGRARFIAAVADVVDACLSGDQQRIDGAQARAMPLLEDAKRYMSATEWLPLAQRVLLAPGTVLSAPVLVEENSVSYFRKLFPTLKAFLRKKDVPAGFVFMADTRAEQPTSSAPVTFLLNFKNSAETKRRWAGSARVPDCVVVSRKPEVLAPAAEYGADFILHRGNETAKAEIANAVNSRAAWRVGLLGEGTTVTSLPSAVTPSRRALEYKGLSALGSTPARWWRRRLYQGAQRPASPTISERYEPSRGTAGLAAKPSPSSFEVEIKSSSFPYSLKPPAAGLAGRIAERERQGIRP